MNGVHLQRQASCSSGMNLYAESPAGEHQGRIGGHCREELKVSLGLTMGV